MRVDLHTHSHASDGSDSPGVLVRAAAGTGLGAVALTDHDTTAGWAEAVEALPRGLTLVPGAELSCVAGSIGVHLLAYLFDPAEPALRAAMERTRAARVPRAREMVRRLQAAGHPVSWEQLSRPVRAGATLGRPHVADALVAAGVVRHRDEAFAGLLHEDGPFYVREQRIDALTGIALVRAAGGVTVFAHPGAARRGPVVADDVVHDMAAAGLAGLEVDHRDHDDATRRRLRALAAEHDLLVTGGSDYHGSGKLNALGENSTDSRAFEALVDRARGGVLVRG